MKKLAISLIAGVSFLITSCGDSPEDLAEDSMDVMKEMTSIIKDVNEGGDPKDAAEELAELGKEMKEIEKRMKEIEMSDEEKKEFDKKMQDKYGEEMKEVMGEMMSELMKLGTSGKEGAAEFAKEVQKLMSDIE